MRTSTRFGHRSRRLRCLVRTWMYLSSLLARRGWHRIRITVCVFLPFLSRALSSLSTSLGTRVCGTAVHRHDASVINTPLLCSVSRHPCLWNRCPQRVSHLLVYSLSLCVLHHSLSPLLLSWTIFLRLSRSRTTKMTKTAKDGEQEANTGRPKYNPNPSAALLNNSEEVTLPSLKQALRDFRMAEAARRAAEL
ncbi:hypothetical protein F5888DRAFT_1344173 [Russula emetica]|nr:hypothetical protein F5888DRAFT_1344173 [Russula emetica]